MRKFNVTGLCVAKKHYMADTSNKLAEIRKMIDNGNYFTINRARQYGKTTTLSLLRRMLPSEYTAASISFEGIGDESFASPEVFCPMLLRQISEALAFTEAPEEYIREWQNNDVINFELLSRHITKMCKGKKIVLMIDEVDKTSNNRIFLHFLGMLRNKFLSREDEMDYTFHSVILAGVYDIKNIKLKMVNEGLYKPVPEESKLYNSPWNIAVNFKVEMSFNPGEISAMLTEYEADHFTNMDITMMSEEIYNYTSGYPFLVSRICQCIDEELHKNWTLAGVQDAVTMILDENNTLFDDLFKNLENNKELYDFIYSILIIGNISNFVINDPLIGLGAMFGFLKNIDGKVVISNKIFEIRMTNYFISKESRSNPKKRITGVLQYDVVKDGQFDMELCLRKFASHYAELFSERDAEFLENHGRLLFLSYLKPLINGQGFYHIESQFTDLRRMDVVVDFEREQFIIELKLWRGESEHQKAYEQLAGYLDSKNAGTGYLLTFDFRKGVNKQPCTEWVDFGGKRIFDVVV